MNRFIVNSKMLFSALDFAGKAIIPNPVVPILENFLIEIKDGVLYAQGTNLDTTVTKSFPVEVYKSKKKDFVFLFPKKGYDYLKVLEEQPITVTIEPLYPNKIEASGEGLVNIHSDEGTATFNTDSPGDFPKSPERKDLTHAFTLPHSSLPDLADMLRYATKDELRPAMTGINFTKQNKQLLLVATDGHMLKTKAIPNVEFFSMPERFIIKRHCARILSEVRVSDIAPDDSGMKVEVNYGANAFFKGLHNGGEVEVITRLIDERYPDFKTVVPDSKTIKSKFTGERKDLLSLLAKTKPFQNGYTKQVELRLAQDKCELFTQNLDFGLEYKAKIPGTLTGEDITIGFNATFLEKALKSFQNDEFSIEMTAPNKCGVIRDKTTLVLFMPVMLNQYV